MNKLINDLRSKQALKIIAGIDNFDKNKVLQLVKIANHLAVTAVDICSQEEIVREALALATDTTIVVSSVVVEELLRAEELGVTVLELGNFEALHKEGIFYGAAEVYALAEELMAKKKSALLSITVPGHLPIAEQIELAVKLEELGVDILQTEGASLVTSKQSSALGQIEKASLTLANTMEIVRATDKAFVLSASGLNPDTVKFAIASGAHGVGVGSYVNKLASEIEIWLLLSPCNWLWKALIESVLLKFNLFLNVSK
jgi:hypothetical protein